jgi:signal transduction histidine kinase
VLAETVLRLSESEFESFVLTWGFLGGGGLSLLLAGVFAWRLARPLTALSQAAREVAEGNFSARAPSFRRRHRGRRQWLSETERLVEDFNAMAATLERLEAERRATAATIAHELRTPITVLQTRLTALQDGVFSFDVREARLLTQQTDQLARLVEDLRTLSLADAGKLTLELYPCDLSSLVADVVASFEARAAAQEVRLETRLAEATVLVDAARLRQVVANLLDNALRLTPPAGTVTVALSVGPTEAVLTVQDTGPGFPDGTGTRVFERFYRGESERSGSGLGLAIVRSLVELHGGRVEAGNAPTGGAVLQVVLPRPRLKAGTEPPRVQMAPRN